MILSARWAATVCVAAVLTAAPRARADSSADEADARFRRGGELYRQRRFDEALLEFFASDRLAHNRNVVFNIARTLEAMGRFQDAYRYYEEYRVEEPDPQEKAATQKKLDELAPQVALLTLESQPTGATVYIDRKDLGGRGETPLVIALSDGEHTVIVEGPGHVAQSVVVNLRKGTRVSQTVTLPLVVGRVVIKSTPPAAVFVDRAEGDERPPDAAATPARLELTPGRHSLDLRAPGYRPRHAEVVVRADAEDKLDLALEALPPPSGTVVVTSSTQGALVYVDGAERGFTPAVLSLVEGRHRLSVRLTGYQPWEEQVSVSEGGHSFFEVQLHEAEPEVEGATRGVQSLGDAPASVSLVPKEEIRALGYETLADALRSVRGLYDSDDKNYRAVGIRGFSRPGDYTNRVLVSRDGHVINDDWVGSGFVGRDFATDLEDVERIEVVRGPGSTYYGPSAFFGVVNVVSEAPGSGPAVRAGGALSSEGGSRAFAHGAMLFPTAGDLAVSVHASAWDTDGETLHFDEFEGTPSGGFVTGADGERSQRVALRAKLGDLSFDAGYNHRVKDVPTAPFDTVFDPAAFDGTSRAVTSTTDARGYLEARFDRTRGAVRLAARAYYDRVDYHGVYPYDDPMGPFVLRDFGQGDWFGGEGRVSARIPGRQVVTVGGEVSAHRVDQSVDEDSDGVLEFDDHHEFVTGSGYLVDELRPTERIQVSGGVRFDRSGGAHTQSFSPRLGVVLQPYEAGRTKLVVGRAFRPPSVYELFYQDNSITQKPAMELDAETIWTAELEHTHSIGARSYVLGSLFASQISGLINLVEDPSDMLLVYRNSTDDARSFGAELEARRSWKGGAWISGAVSVARLSSDDEAVRVNSASVTGIAMGWWPAANGQTGLAAEVVYNGPRPLRDGGLSDHMVLANVAASGKLGDQGLRFRVGVENLLDWDWDVPVGEEFVQQSIRQEGRTLVVQLAWEQ